MALAMWSGYTCSSSRVGTELVERGSSVSREGGLGFVCDVVNEL